MWLHKLSHVSTVKACPCCILSASYYTRPVLASKDCKYRCYDVEVEVEGKGRKKHVEYPGQKLGMTNWWDATFLKWINTILKSMVWFSWIVVSFIISKIPVCAFQKSSFFLNPRISFNIYCYHTMFTRLQPYFIDPQFWHMHGATCVDQSYLKWLRLTYSSFWTL